MRVRVGACAHRAWGPWAVGGPRLGLGLTEAGPAWALRLHDKGRLQSPVVKGQEMWETRGKPGRSRMGSFLRCPVSRARSRKGALSKGHG